MIILSETHKANLDKLATYLESLPDDYEHFDMSAYYSMAGDEMDVYDIYDDNLHAPHSCGAVACAVGHGPAAGVPVPRGINSWFSYSLGSFGLALHGSSRNGQTRNESEAAAFLFSERWAVFYQNKARHAAQRIRILLSKGEPPKCWSFTDPPYVEEED